MKTYYTLLEVHPEASQDEITKAYQQQRERYDPQRFGHIDDDLRQIAEQRLRELDAAYATLSDREQRQQYNQRIGETAAPSTVPVERTASVVITGKQSGLTMREWLFASGGMLLAVSIIMTIWLISGSVRSETSLAGAVDQPAPDFTLPALDGTNVNLADYRGQVVLLNFWGTWCEPCIRETPALQAAYTDLKDEGFVIIGVNLTRSENIQGRSEADIQAFVDQYGITYPIALDIDGQVASDYNIHPIPTSKFVDAHGHVRYVRFSELNEEEIKSLFHALQSET